MVLRVMPSDSGWAPPSVIRVRTPGALTATPRTRKCLILGRFAECHVFPLACNLDGAMSLAHVVELVKPTTMPLGHSTHALTNLKREGQGTSLENNN